MGANEGTLHRASQPSIIMHPDSAMPTGPSKTHVTRITSVARREPLMACEYPARVIESQVLAWESAVGRFLVTKRPPVQSPGGLAACRSSDLRELTRLDHVNEDVPFVLPEDGEITGLADADLITSKLHFRALPTACWAQQHFPVVQCTHLLPFTIFRRSMWWQTVASPRRGDREDDLSSSLRPRRTSVRSARVRSSSSTFCRTRSRTWGHGQRPDRLIWTTSLIS